MRYELKSIGIWAFVRVSFFLHLIVGFLFGLFYAAMLMLILTVASSGPLDTMSDLPFDMRAVGPLLMIILPIAFAVGGAVMGTLIGVVLIAGYNLIVRMTGGFEFELAATSLPAPGAPATAVPKPVDPLAFMPPPPPPPGSPTIGPITPPPTYNPPPPPPSTNWPDSGSPENP